MTISGFLRLARPLALSGLLLAAGGPQIGATLDLVETSATVYTVPSSITSNCSSDVTSTLNTWIASVPNGSVLSFRQGACYRIDGSVRVTKRYDLTLEGNGSTFRAVTLGDRYRRHFWFMRGGNLTVRNLTVIGANPHAGMYDDAAKSSYEGQHAFSFLGVQGAVLDHVQAFDVFGDFVYVGADSNNVPSRNVSVLNSTFSRNGRQGIAVVAGEHVLIQGNSLSQMRLSAIDLEPIAKIWTVSDVQVLDNSIGPQRLTFLSAASWGAVHDVTFLRNDIRGSMKIGIKPMGSFRYHGFTFVDNVATASVWQSAPLIGLYRVDDLVFQGNTVPFKAGSGTDLMSLRNSCHVRVMDNKLPGVDAIFVVRDGLSCDYIQAGNQK
jgi:hypothetical protein